MYWSVRLRRLQNRMVLRAFSHSVFIRHKLLYLIQSNGLYQIDEFTKRVVVDNRFQNKKQVQISAVAKYQISKNATGDKNLEIRFLKTGSSIDEKFMNLDSQLQSLFNAQLLEKQNRIDCTIYTLLYKENQENLEMNLADPVELKPTGKIELSKRHDWNYISKPHLILGGNSGSGKSYLLFSIVRKIQRETANNKIFICDGKFDELSEVSRTLFSLPYVAKNVNEIVSYVNMVEELMEARYSKKSLEKSAIFLIIDEFAALKLVLEKSDFQELNRSLKNVVLKGRAANIHVLVAMQRASSTSIDLDIRDNTAVKIGLGNLSQENFKMIFGENRAESGVISRGIGQGYILIDGSSLSLFEAPKIRME